MLSQSQIPLTLILRGQYFTELTFGSRNNGKYRYNTRYNTVELHNFKFLKATIYNVTFLTFTHAVGLFFEILRRKLKTKS